ncbi:MAG TPA: hypothetical protein VJ967_11910 [Clostridia bacterium]|nr:hypothetical protein [Clostridia bacterium]
MIAAKRTRIIKAMEIAEGFEVMIEDSFQRLEAVVSNNALERISSLERKLEQLEQELVNFIEAEPSETKTD